ncbi:MAG: YhcN/YlaJ family sporulation lipoprotein [Tissierellia bacterium]|nr:YhcN/YlaJ family sporulation lipoprotein [Tissierellia bacterium]
MKKNKLIFLSLILALVFIAIGCTARPDTLDRTQTRIGLENRNNALRRNNTIRRNNLGLDDNMRDLDDDLLGREDTVERNRLRNNIVNDRDFNNNMNNSRELARKIANRVEDIEGINRAYVLISGDTAIVGVNMDNEAEGQITRDLKDRIERVVKKVDNDIDNVSITADPDLLTRIRNMFEDIDEGNPIEGFANQFEEILRRITPIR